MAHDVFISYSSKDKAIADAVCASLEAAKIRCWIAPRDILPGDKWAASITKAIINSRLMVLVFTSNSNNSEDVLNELRLAKDYRVIIIPFKIGDILPGWEMEYYLKRTHWLDAMDPPTENEIQKLVETVSLFIKHEVFWKKDIKDTAINEFNEEIRIPIREKKEIKTNGDSSESKNNDSLSSIPYDGLIEAKENEYFDIKKKERISFKIVLIAAIVLGLLSLGYWVVLQYSAQPPLMNNFTNSIGMEFVLIPAGEFDMGSPESEKDRDSDEGPVHNVRISNAYYMGKYEVTQEQWVEVMGTNPSYFKGDKLPVEEVTWNEAQEFINKLNEKEGTNKYRLPSEAEWEYAARAGTTTKYSFGDDESKLDNYAWCGENLLSGGGTHNVGQKNPNPWGLYDMLGNADEWVQDKWHENYDSAPTDGSAWEAGSRLRVSRGGSFSTFVRNCRSADRTSDSGYRVVGQGFRLLKVL